MYNDHHVTEAVIVCQFMYGYVLASHLLNFAWVSVLRENLPLLQTLQSSHAQDRMAFVILWS